MVRLVAPAPPAPLFASIWGGYRPEGSRDLRLDFLRGFAVVAMIVDHIGGPSWLYALTGGNRFYTSAAEGFIFLSGLLVGVVYGRLARRDGFAVAMQKALARAGTLYLLTVSVTLPLIVVSEALALPWATGVSLADPVGLIVSVLTLHRTYYLIDVMVLYTLLLAVAPVALYLLVAGQTRVLLLLSWGLWLAFQLAPDYAEVPWQIAGNYLFHFSAWQVLFFTAMVIGYHRERLARWVGPRAQAYLLVASGIGFLGLLVLYRLGDRPWQWLSLKQPVLDDPANLVVLLFGKGDVRPGRVLASAIVFLFLFLVVTKAWRPLYRALGWLLMPLGQNALYAYTAHIVLVVVIGVVLQVLGWYGTLGRGGNTLLQVAGLLLVWWLIQRRIAFPARGEQWRWALVPVVAASVALLVLPRDAQPPASAAAEALGSTRYRANAFGTPIPRDARGVAVPAGFPTPQPLPEPRRAPGGRFALGNPLPEYVGPLRGRFLEMTFFSRALAREMPYYLYLPPDYDDSNRAYPVLYLLHGASGDFAEWPAIGFVDQLDRAIVFHEVEPFIVVMPQGDFGYWLNHADDGPRWGDYVTLDLVAHIDGTYRTLRRPYRRAIGGLSMGGTGALVQAFTHPDVFGIVGAHSPSLREDNSVLSFLGTGDEFNARDPIYLAATAPDLGQLQIWLDIGEADPWVFRVEQLHQVLAERGIEHQFNVWPGDHLGEYWQEHIPDYLRFYSWALTLR
ncbi:MAG TPA: OpgC domain-containing protein [Chloroflexota bacterium]|jgi:enterochelin esterase-like enzyme|nr:OpgC domain-containing protein [Chloroflexota bacterium]